MVRSLLKILKNFAKLKEYRFFLHWRRLKLQLLIVQYVRDKYTLPFHWRIRIQLQSQIVSIRHNPEVQKVLLDWLDTKKCQDFRHSVHPEQQATTRITKTHVFDWRQSSHLHERLNLQEGLWAAVYGGSFWICCNYFGKPPTYTINDEQDEIICAKFYQKELIKVVQQWNRLQ